MLVAGLAIYVGDQVRCRSFISRVCYIVTLEVEFGEEPLVLTGLVFLFQSLLDNLLGFFFLGGLFQGLGADSTLEGVNIQGVSCWHQVVVVDQLDKRLDSVSGRLGFLLLVGQGWSPLDTNDNGVREGVAFGALVDWLDDNNLLTGVTTTGNNS